MFGDDDGERIRGRAENRADFRDRLDLIEYVERKRVSEHHDKHMPRRDRIGGGDRGGFEHVVGAGVPHQARLGRLAERDAEFHARHRLHNRLVEVFDGLDEMGLADDHIDVGGGLRDFDCLQFHRKPVESRLLLIDTRLNARRCRATIGLR